MTLRWFACPDLTDQRLGLVPRMYRQDLDAALAGTRPGDGPWALRVDAGIPADGNLLDGNNLDHLAAVLAKRLRNPHLVSVWATKGYNDQTFVQSEAAQEVAAPASAVVVANSAGPQADYRDRIRAAVAGAAELPPGPVRLELSFVTGPERFWPALWTPTVAALDPLLGRRDRTRAGNILTGRIIELGLHHSVDPRAGSEVTVGIAAAPAELSAEHTRYVVRAAARSHGWQVFTNPDPDQPDLYRLPATGKSVEVYWAASGGVLMAFATDGAQSSAVWRGDDIATRAPRVLSALTTRSAVLPPAPEHGPPRYCADCAMVHSGGCPCAPRRTRKPLPR